MFCAKTKLSLWIDYWILHPNVCFSNKDEVVKFLFMIHSVNTRAKDELIKSMKPESTLLDIIAIAKSVKSTIIAEKHSRVTVHLRYRLTLSVSEDIVQVREVANTSPIQITGQDSKNQVNHLTIVGKHILQISALHSAKHAISAKRRDISPNFAVHFQAPDHHQIIKDNPIRIFIRLYNQRSLMVICSCTILM